MGSIDCVRSGGPFGRCPDIPPIAIIKDGITFNQKFVDAYGLIVGSGLFVFVDKEKRRIRFKISDDNGDAIPSGSFRIQASSGKTRHCSTKKITAKRIPQTFPDCVKRVFRAHMNPADKVIEVSLAPDNTV